MDRGRAATVGSTEGGEDQGSPGGGGEVGGDVAHLIGRVLGVLVQWHRPLDLLGRGIDLNRAGDLAHGRKHLAGHLTDRPIGDQRHGTPVPVVVFHNRLVRMQAKGDDKGARAMGGGQRRRLPAPRGEPQCGVLQLGLGRCESRGDLAEHLAVGMESVERWARLLIGESGPRADGCHAVTVAPHGQVAVAAPEPTSRQRTTSPLDQSTGEHGHGASQSQPVFGRPTPRLGQCP